ncbi:hypothetical protein BH11PLA2_BH11PLA2_09900 [soil metagenome]
MILLQNAVEAIGERREGEKVIRIESTLQSDQATIRIADTGNGIAEPGRIFDRFYTTKPEGFGLGLAMARTIAETHGGRLDATSSNRGAVFALTLPTDTMTA